MLPEDERGNIVIFGSAAVALNGVDLGRKVNDLDVFVSDETFERLKEKCGLEELTKNGDVPYLEFENLEVEILKTFPGVEFSEVKACSSTSDISQELMFGDLEMLSRWKRKQGRDKDLDDLNKMGLS